jgi:AraC-like DNA-binding protein
MPTIASTSTLAMVRAAEARGVDPTDVLAGAGVTRDQLEDPDARLQVAQVLAVWNALRQRTGDRALQLTAPLTLPWGTYRVIDYLVAASATVGDGVVSFARFFGLIADAVELTIGREGDGHFLEIRLADGEPVPPVYVDYVFAALVSRVRLRVRPGLQLLRVELRQPQPDDVSPYDALFLAPVRFGAQADRLWFGDEEWRAPVVSPDAALAQLLEEHARMLALRGGAAAPGFRRDVQNAITATLTQGATADDVARVLHVSVRTLQRRLSESGTTFHDVSDAVRARLAAEYLADPRVGIAEVAFLLGFSDQSSFNRAFRRWTGEAPGRWRKQRRVRDTGVLDAGGTLS